MEYLFSPSANAFYPNELKSYYEAAGSLPADLIEVDSEVFDEFTATPEGKIRVVGNDGMPAWGDVPPPTQAEIIAETEREKQRRIAAANEFMNSKQWPGKAAIGRLKGDELEQYNLWLDYLDALEALDTSSATDWPTPPVV
ncbi:tail fiber assembly protein [Escherichia coli]|nr:tail fiber assembly protein [Escherichia coli]EEX4484326.1 tail fiber assembly protein [Escherichia coli]